MKKHKSKFLLLANYSSIREERMRQNLFACVGNSLFTIRDKQTLLYTMLKCIRPIGKQLRNNPTSIEKASLKLLRHFHLDGALKRAILIRQSDGKAFSSDEFPTLSPVEKVWKYVFQLTKLPAETYESLRIMVAKDLADIESLIKWYEGIPVIQQFVQNGRRPGNHTDRILYDFYQRCILEKATIASHLANGIRKRAIVNAGDFGGLSAIQDWSKTFYDRPYYFAREWGHAYYDCREIDQVSHRLIDLNGDELTLRKLYEKDKARFYRRLLKKEKLDFIFEELSFNLRQIPLGNDRLPIFEELKHLFRKKYWIGYYALALSQVEGLFTEMCQAVQVVEEKRWYALSAKVEKIRPHFALSQYYFDYYEYHIPKHRNKFMHVGVGEDYKMQSHDLLLDLRHLLRVFQELDNPYIKVHKLIKQRDPMKFMDYRDFAYYFSLLDAMPKDKMKDLKEELKSFEKDFLMDSTPIEYICFEIYEQLPKVIENFMSDISSRIYPASPIDFSTIKLIKTVLEDAKLTAHFKNFYYLQGHNVQDLTAYKVFLQKASKYLPFLTRESKKLVAEMQGQYGHKLKHIAMLGDWILRRDKI